MIGLPVLVMLARLLTNRPGIVSTGATVRLTNSNSVVIIIIVVVAIIIIIMRYRLYLTATF